MIDKHSGASEFEYTKDRHHRIETTLDGLRVQFGAATRRPGTFREECALAAADIGRSTIDHLYICMSGGMDAEIVCRAFLDAGLRDRVTPLILVWPNGLNAYDLKLARDYCDSVGLALEERAADVAALFGGGYWMYSDRLRQPMGAGVWKSWIADQHDGFLIIGDGWMQSYCDEATEVIRLKVDSTHENPFEALGRTGVPFFFRYSPELMLSILLDPDIYRWCVRCHMPLERLYDVLTFKYFALSKYYENDDIPLAYRIKRTGVEGLPSERAAFHDSEAKYGDRVASKTWGYDEFITELGGDPYRSPVQRGER